MDHFQNWVLFRMSLAGHERNLSPALKSDLILAAVRAFVDSISCRLLSNLTFELLSGPEQPKRKSTMNGKYFMFI
jgi:hypothetical protein